MQRPYLKWLVVVVVINAVVQLVSAGLRLAAWLDG